MSAIARAAARATAGIVTLGVAVGLATVAVAALHTTTAATTTAATTTAATTTAGTPAVAAAFSLAPQTMLAPADIALPYGPDTCVNGFVWRAARPGDSVCVTPAVRTETAQENLRPHNRGGLFTAFGSCDLGYTRRGAYPGDQVCVTYGQWVEVLQDNAHAQQRYLRNQQATTTAPAGGASGGASAGGGGLSGDESELLRLINDARLHPESYAPNGNTAGATMTGCATPFAASPALTGTARNHNTYLASQPIDVVNTYPNMHKDPDGKLAWEAGEPMAQAGYNSFRSEIVATGFATPAAAVQFWMQNDAGSNWGHRNLILNCSIADAGPAALAASPGGHYWTVDMGTR